MSFRNRCIVACPTAPIHLSVPVQNGRDQKGPARDVRIDQSDDWQRRHWRTLFSCYGSAPFFEYYRDWLEAFYRRSFIFLYDMNLETFQWLADVYKYPGAIALTQSFSKTCPPSVTDLRGRYLPKNYQAEPPLITYSQVFGAEAGFQPNLSMLDLLFCAGPKGLGLRATFE